jgi:hypothetical protein
LTPAQRYDQLVQHQHPAEPQATQQSGWPAAQTPPAQPAPARPALTQPAPTQPAPAQAAPTQPASTQPAPAQPAPTHWTAQPAPRQRERVSEAQPTEQTGQTPQQPAREQAGQAPPNGAAGDEEGWRFWPPADQAGEGAYQRPT